MANDRRRKYPSKWYRVEQRGCAPGCLHLNWPLERCDVTPQRTVTRHVMPKRVLAYCLDSQTFSWRTFHTARWRWYAVAKRRKGSVVTRVAGQTEREAMQNLCAELKLSLP